MPIPDASPTAPPYTAAEVAEILFLDRTTVLRQAKSGEIPGATKLAGSRGAWIFDRDTIDRIALQRLDERQRVIDAARARLGAAS